ncbi:MAG: hypothetical protein ACJ8A0_18465 [Microvirga sp.]
MEDISTRDGSAPAASDHSPGTRPQSTGAQRMSSATAETEPTSSSRARRSAQPTGRGFSASIARMASIFSCATAFLNSIELVGDGVILPAMTTIQDIEQAVAQLAPHELAAFRTWFEAFDADRFDEKIERDAASGKLDQLANEALANHRKGRSREL